MYMGASRYCTTASFAPILSHLALLSLSLLVRARDSNNPSTDWTLSDYYNVSDSIHSYRFDKTSFRVCNNGGTNLELLDDAQGLYGRATNISSYHSFLSYTVYFRFYFVIPADKICMRENAEVNGSIPAYYLSLVALNAFGRTPDPNRGQVVWTANPMNPVTINSCLLLNDSGLTLVESPDSSEEEVVWHASTNASDVSLAINFEGNIVLFSNSTNPLYESLWESFRYPSDTLMALQVLENGHNLTVNSSSSASSSGIYTLALENGRLVLYARIGYEENPLGYPYWVWPPPHLDVNDNISFAAFCWDSINQLRLIIGSTRPSNDSNAYRGMVSPQFCSTIANNSDTTMQITGLNKSIGAGATFATFLRLEADGDLRAYSVDNTTYPGRGSKWKAFYSVFGNMPCALPLSCGFYGMGIHDQRGTNCSCSCEYSQDPKLVLADASDSKSGCKPANGDVAQLWDIQNISSSDEACTIIDNIAACASKGSRCEVDFMKVDNVDYFSLKLPKSRPERFLSRAGCRRECKKNCSCTAAFWNEGLCFHLVGRLGTIQRQGTTTVFIKYVKIMQASPSRLKVFVVVPVLAATLLVACIFLAYWRRNKAQKMGELQKERLQTLSMLDVASTERFTWKEMHEYTCGFSDLLGAGGFGHVFRGALPDGRAIAVKQLDVDQSEGQGHKEFIAEVSILSRIHHAHLVRLIGFCLQGSHRLLVYEYMENGPLAAWLFKKKHVPSVLQEHHDMHRKEKGKGNSQLPWKTRFQIAVGTAKGLAYLHEECEERIIHMDLKPQNILLGRNFVPKISDFGMSRRTAREQSSVMTVMRGTPGYLAPEWLLDAGITEKCDVYSFGIMLLEMVCGRKVTDVRELKRKLSLRSLREIVMQDFLDESLRHDSDVNEKEAVRMVEVGMLCVRMDPRKRPAMSSVALILELGEEVQEDVHALEDDKLIMYLSSMNRTMRILQPQPHGKHHSFTSYSFTDSASSAVRRSWGNRVFSSSPDDNNTNYSEKKMKMHNNDNNNNNSYKKRYLRSLSKTEAPSPLSTSEEWDGLLL